MTGNSVHASGQVTPNDIDGNPLFQDVLSQFPALNGHTQLVIGFRLSPDTSNTAVTDELKLAIESLICQIPWLNGQVVEKDGLRLPAPWPADGPKHEIVRSKDCSHLLPTMAQLLKDKVPISKLDAQVLSPFAGLSAGHTLEPPVPIVALQANFIHGGLLLTLCLHHVVMDGTASFQLIRHLATALQGKLISPQDLLEANRDRRSVMRLLAPGEPAKDYSDLRRPPGFSYPAVLSPPTWCSFKLPIAAVNGLMKATRSQGLSLVSENDVICAFCWQRISTVRLGRMGPETVSKFSRAIDGRIAAGVSFSYMGHMVYHANLRLPIGFIASSTLASIAEKLRHTLDSVNNEWTLRSYATFIAREPDKSNLLYGGKTNPNTDLGATSALAGTDIWPSTFGPSLGPSCFMRRSRTTPIVGSISMSPAEGDFIPVTLCLPGEDMEGLRCDREWMRYTKVIG